MQSTRIIRRSNVTAQSTQRPLQCVEQASISKSTRTAAARVRPSHGFALHSATRQTQPLSLNLLAPGGMGHFKERRNHSTRHEIRHPKEHRKSVSKQILKDQKCDSNSSPKYGTSHKIYTPQHSPITQITLPLTLTSGMHVT